MNRRSYAGRRSWTAFWDIALAIVVGGVLFVLLVVVTGGILVSLVTSVAAIALLGLVHALTWGQAWSRSSLSLRQRDNRLESHPPDEITLALSEQERRALLQVLEACTKADEQEDGVIRGLLQKLRMFGA